MKKLLTIAALSLIVGNTMFAMMGKDKRVIYFNDMDNPINLRIVVKRADIYPFGAYIAPHQELPLDIPGGQIAELEIQEMENGKVYKKETILSRKKDRSIGDPFFDADPIAGVYRVYDKDADLNSDDRYVIMHNRINPKRAFRLLDRQDLKLRQNLPAEVIDFLIKTN